MNKIKEAWNKGVAEAVWDSMSDAEKVDWIATKIMGWRKNRGSSWRHGRWMKEGIIWNPIESWRSWRHVEEKVMSDEDLLWEFVHKIDGMERWGDPETVVLYMQTLLPTRARALYLAYQSLR